jgi:hypothetical protein
MTAIENLPVDILRSIFHGFELDDLITVRTTCSSFRDAVDSIKKFSGTVNAMSMTNYGISSLPLVDYGACKFVFHYHVSMICDMLNVVVATNNKLNSVVIHSPSERLWQKYDGYTTFYPMLHKIKCIELHSNFPVNEFFSLKSVEEVVWDIGGISFDTSTRLCMIVLLLNIKKLTLRIGSAFELDELFDFKPFIDIINEKDIHVTISTYALMVDKFADYRGIKRLTIYTYYVGCVGTEPFTLRIANHKEFTLHLINFSRRMTVVFQNVKQFTFHDISQFHRTYTFVFKVYRNPSAMFLAGNGDVVIE